MNIFRTSAILRMTAVLIERGFTIALAVLLLRLHEKMATTHSIGFMQSWVRNERVVTIVVIAFLGLALVLTVAAEALIIQEEPQLEAAAIATTSEQQQP